jgi:hypothetical protein
MPESERRAHNLLRSEATNSSFEKLQQVIHMFQSSDRHINIWEQASRRLITEFCHRAPKMKDVIAVFRDSFEVTSIRGGGCEADGNVLQTCATDSFGGEVRYLSPSSNP